MSRSGAMVQSGQAVARRRRRTLEEKVSIVRESRSPGSSVVEAARRYAVNPKQVYTWRRLFDLGALEPNGPVGTRLIEVQMNGEPAAVATPAVRRAGASEGRIEITLADGVQIAVCGSVEAERLEQVLGVLRR